LQVLRNVCLFAAIVLCYREIIRGPRNKGPGEGAIFDVHFPLVERTPAPELVAKAS